jgi:hypothetical protein
MPEDRRARLTALVAEMRKDAAAHEAEAVNWDRQGASGSHSAARERVLAQVHRYWADQLAALLREPAEVAPLEDALRNLPRHLRWRIVDNFERFQRDTDADDEFVRWKDIEPLLRAARAAAPTEGAKP